MVSAPNPHIVRTSAIEFQYNEFGPSTGRPVFLLHGFPDDPSTWNAMIKRLDLDKLNVRLIAPWLRGYGKTSVLHDELQSGQLAALADDVFGLADALGIRRFAVIGHDWGARAGYAACVLDPQRVLAHFALSSLYGISPEDTLPPEQVDAYWYQWHFQTPMGERSLNTNLKEFCRFIWHRWSPSWNFGSSEFSEAAKSWESPKFVETVLLCYRHMWGNALGRPAYTEAQAKLDAVPKLRISVPTFFAYGTDDHCVLPESSVSQRALFAGKYERVAIQGVGHFPQREDPKTVAKLVQRFLEGLQG